jgi:hypothetical protein
MTFFVSIFYNYAHYIVVNVSGQRRSNVSGVSIEGEAATRKHMFGVQRFIRHHPSRSCGQFLAELLPVPDVRAVHRRAPRAARVGRAGVEPVRHRVRRVRRAARPQRRGQLRRRQEAGRVGRRAPHCHVAQHAEALVAVAARSDAVTARRRAADPGARRARRRPPPVPPDRQLRGASRATTRSRSTTTTSSESTTTTTPRWTSTRSFKRRSPIGRCRSRRSLPTPQPVKQALLIDLFDDAPSTPASSIARSESAPVPTPGTGRAAPLASLFDLDDIGGVTAAQLLPAAATVSRLSARPICSTLSCSARCSRLRARDVADRASFRRRCRARRICSTLIRLAPRRRPAAHRWRPRRRHRSKRHCWTLISKKFTIES